jgi:catechol 2,3-dioxygenase-like lactoylglutathione lyase family enzyme
MEDAMITKIAFIGQPTRDLAESRRFYGEVLGLKNSVNYADHWSEYQTPDGKTIALDTFSPKESPHPASYLALETDDIVAEVARLKAAGVSVIKDVWVNDDGAGTEVCKMAIILDPDGNTVILHQIAPHRA